MEEYFPAKECEYIRKKGFNVQNLIGEGAFGKVFKGNARAKDLSGNVLEYFFAMKVLDLRAVGQVLKMIYIPREIKALETIKHKFVISVYFIISHGQFKYVIMELASNGSLSHMLTTEGSFSESQSALWFGQITEALVYIHEHHRLAHRDIKLENVLLDKDMNAKLADFGLVSQSDMGKPVDKSPTTMSNCGTPDYSCPQINEGRPYNPYQADVWSLGVLLFIMLECRFPFVGDPESDLKLQQDYPRYISSIITKMDPLGKSLVLAMLIPDENKRIKMKEVLGSQFLVKFYHKDSTRSSSSNNDELIKSDKDNDLDGSKEMKQINSNLADRSNKKPADLNDNDDTPQSSPNDKQNNTAEKKQTETKGSSKVPNAELDQKIARTNATMRKLFKQYYDDLKFYRKSIIGFSKIIEKRQNIQDMAVEDLVNMHNMQEDRNIELNLEINLIRQSVTSKKN